MAILREKVSIILIATMGGRIEVLGNYDGSDGLRVRDTPEMVIDNSAKTLAYAALFFRSRSVRVRGTEATPTLANLIHKRLATQVRPLNRRAA